MGNFKLRLVGGRDFRPDAPASRAPYSSRGTGGWPLSPQLLAALQNADAKTLKRAQTALMIALDWDMVVVMKETP